METQPDEFSGTEAVRPGMELPVRVLCEWLMAHVTGFRGPLGIRQFRGGQSNPTFKLVTPIKSYVLRMKPRGVLLKGAHAIEREFRVTRELRAAGFPVAPALALCTDSSVIGSPFYVMDLVAGRTFWDSTFLGVTRAERGKYFDCLNDTLASLHSLNPGSLNLDDYGRSNGYLERQLARWSKQYLEDELAGRNAHMDKLVEWLAAHIPAGDANRIVHGDFRADNVIFANDRPEVLAVLDWELSTLGDPLADFTYHLMMYHLPPTIIGGFAGADLDLLGIPSELEYIKAYCDRTGRQSIGNLHFYLAFNMFRFAAILHGIRGRIVRGTASSANAQSMADNFVPMAALAWHQAQLHSRAN